MAVEQKRGCGYRKVGGLYLVSGGIGAICDRLPFELNICPCCGQGIKQARSWTWVNIGKLFQGPHSQLGAAQEFLACDCNDGLCPLCKNPESMDKAGLLWIGEKFYKTPADFIKEGVEMGFSRRIKAVPQGFKIGETWVLLAHPKTVVCSACDGTGWVASTDEHCKNCEAGRRPGIFFVWRPQRIEKIVLESQRGSEEIEALEKRGITPVYVPDDDPDHQGNVHDDFDREQQEKNKE
jgi:hypothetical protein